MQWFVYKTVKLDIVLQKIQIRVLCNFKYSVMYSLLPSKVITKVFNRKINYVRKDSNRITSINLLSVRIREV